MFKGSALVKCQRQQESPWVSEVQQSLVSVSEYSICHEYSKGDSICNVVIGCGMNGQPLLCVRPVHLLRQSCISLPCLSVYFNSYQIEVFLQKGIKGYSLGETDKYPMYNSRKLLVQDLAPQS